MDQIMEALQSQTRISVIVDQFRMADMKALVDLFMEPAQDVLPFETQLS